MSRGKFGPNTKAQREVALAPVQPIDALILPNAMVTVSTNTILIRCQQLLAMLCNQLVLLLPASQQQEETRADLLGHIISSSIRDCTACMPSLLISCLFPSLPSRRQFQYGSSTALLALSLVQPRMTVQPCQRLLLQFAMDLFRRRSPEL